MPFAALFSIFTLLVDPCMSLLSTEAVADANKAIELNPSLPKAYLRKGTACMKLEEYQLAKAALQTGASLAPRDSKFTNLLKQCHDLIAEESHVITPIIPEKHTMITRAVSAKELRQENGVAEQMTVTVARPKYRHEFYQKPDEVVVTIFAKGIPQDSVTVDFGEQILSVSIEVPGEDAYSLQPRLFGKIVPAKCRYEVLSTKMEIRLAKVEHIHWTALEFRGGATVPQRAIVSSVTDIQRPSYPSSKPKRVDWDKLEAQVKKEEKEEKLDGDAALNKFFRQIYQDADEDTRRAMSKSFVESNGTVLSTNWKEVGSKKVEGSAPDGMELKNWEY
ncbi:Cochaperone protein, variant 3 [Stylosanthes scabra]|uniref:Cochaperone protein, variant 3 n=1 Tax=Stylosanthes scabra TaxID=79078 RepID=A0ABU6RE25_9FABA|nr:Cochaperone protein, variant 3 [Stylosanthes scabra]